MLVANFGEADTDISIAELNVIKATDVASGKEIDTVSLKPDEAILLYTAKQTCKG